MNHLFQLSEFLNLPTIIAFALGILSGFILLLLVYLLAVIRGMNRGLKRRKVEEEDIDFTEIKWLIENAKKQFKEIERSKEESTIINTFNVSKELAHDIASKYYPQSKYPLQELSVDEILVLTHYISNRLDELLQAKILGQFRGMTIRQILSIKITGSKVTSSKVYKTAVGAQLGKVWGAMKVVNPFYWIKKGTVDQVIKIIIRKIALNAIVITGEETYKIYSKSDKIFESLYDNELDIKKIYDELENDEEESKNVKEKETTK